MQRTFFDDELQRDMKVKRGDTRDHGRYRAELTPEVQKRVHGYADVILEMLKERCCTNSELIKATSHRFSSVLDVLRQRGHDIETEDLGEGAFRYHYRGYTPTVKVKPEWKDAYYHSGHWRMKRNARLALDAFTCSQCKSKSDLQVHHWTYDLFNEDLESLVTLCVTCHQRLHELKAVQIHFPRYVSSEIAERLKSICVDAPRCA